MESYKEFRVVVHVEGHDPQRVCVYATTKYHACDKALYEYTDAHKVTCQGVERTSIARQVKTIADKW